MARKRRGGEGGMREYGVPCVKLHCNVSREDAERSSVAEAGFVEGRELVWLGWLEV